MANSTKPKWLLRQEYPFQAHFLEQDGYQQHYIDEGSGPILLFIHGTPSWSFDFRHLIKSLSRQFRCIALDHLGFGLSEKSPLIDYSLPAHVRRAEQLIAALELRDITLVLHDFGGPIGLEYALHYPDNVEKLVILNSWIGSSENDPAFRRLKHVLQSPLLPFLYRYLNFSARFVLPAAFGKRKLSAALKKQYTSPFPDRHSRAGTLAFVKSLLQDQGWFNQQWQRREILHAHPVLLIWGMADKIVTPFQLNRFQEAFPQASILKIPDAGHFPQEEYPELILPPLLSFLQES